MYESLKEFNNIVVSGPQRSGTRFTARVIASDTEKTFIDEKDINFHDFRLLEYYINRGNCVIQCPGLCHMLHHIIDPKTLVIMMIRSTSDIEASERRIGWPKEARLLELYKYGRSEGVISRIKYEFWNLVQAKLLGERARTIDFENLIHHPLFVKKQDRTSFTWDQTQ